MKKIDWEVMQQNIADYFPWKKGSRLAVLLEPLGYCEEIWEVVREFLMPYYDWNYQKDLNQCMPDGVIGMGSLFYLQKIYQMREDCLAGEIPLLLFSDGDRWQELCRETLWIRGRDGRSQYWGFCKTNDKDLLIIQKNKEVATGRDDFVTGGGCLTSSRKEMLVDREDGCMTTDRGLLWESLIWDWKEAMYCIKQGTVKEERAVVSRGIVEELAEPLRILLDIPMAVGSYFAVQFLYSLLTKEQKSEFGRLVFGGGMEHLCGKKEKGGENRSFFSQIEQEYANWWLERVSLRYCPEAIRGIVVPGGCVSLLTEMAMEGIENYPPQQQLDWCRVEEFYRGLS